MADRLARPGETRLGHSRSAVPVAATSRKIVGITKSRSIEFGRSWGRSSRVVVCEDRLSGAAEALEEARALCPSHDRHFSELFDDQARRLLNIVLAAWVSMASNPHPTTLVVWKRVSLQGAYPRASHTFLVASAADCT
jgi:hypothetical protein